MLLYMEILRMPCYSIWRYYVCHATTSPLEHAVWYVIGGEYLHLPAEQMRGGVDQAEQLFPFFLRQYFRVYCVGVGGDGGLRHVHQTLTPVYNLHPRDGWWVVSQIKLISLQSFLTTSEEILLLEQNSVFSSLVPRPFEGEGKNVPLQTAWEQGYAFSCKRLGRTLLHVD